MTLTLTPKQAKVLQEALDTYMRLGMYQLDAVLRVLDHPDFCAPMFHLNAASRDSIRAHLSAILGIIFADAPPVYPKVQINAGPGISNPIVHDNFKIAYDLDIAIRGDAHPLHLGSEPVAKVTP